VDTNFSKVELSDTLSVEDQVTSEGEEVTHKKECDATSDGTSQKNMIAYGKPTKLGRTTV
jgi:hypothetical protein